jgi:cell division septation protein DedD
MYTFLFDKKSLVLLLTGTAVAGGLVFFGGVLVGVQWSLPFGSYNAPVPSRTTQAALPAERPCKPEPEAAPAPVAPLAPATPEPAAPEFEEPEPEPRTFAAAALPQEAPAAFEEPRPEPVEASPEPAVLTASREGRYSLQIGAFRRPENSEKVIQDLQSKGYEPYVIEERGRRVLKTVRIGRYADRGEALKAASDFRRREGMEAIVRPIG